jgi:hypothetical protein
MIDRFNVVSCWVSSQILMANDFKEQTRVLEHFIMVAKHCHDLANYNSLMEILAGLNHFTVQRLQSLWKSISEKHTKLFNQLDEVMLPQNNYKNYQDELWQRLPKEPTLPYLGIFLRDITFILEGNQMVIDKELNHKLLTMLWRQAQALEQFQQKGYQNLKTNGWVKGHLCSLTPMEDDDLFALSKKWTQRSSGRFSI